MMFDGVSSKADATLAVLEAEQSAKGDALNDLEADAADAGEVASTATASGDAPSVEKTPEQVAEAKWEASAELREEFGDNKGAYMAYAVADANGQVKILGGDK